jgi:hypothetical protein
MQKQKIKRYVFGILTAFAFVMLSGCWILSFFPLYHENDLVFDKNLLGDWVNQNETDDVERWTFLQGEDKAYRLIITDDNGIEGEFDAHLLGLNDILYLDLLPKEPEGNNEFQVAHMVPCHSFLRIELSDDQLYIRAMDYDWLDDRLKDGRVSIKHSRRKDGFILTSPTKILQKFIKKYSDEVFSSEAGILKRVHE